MASGLTIPNAQRTLDLNAGPKDFSLDFSKILAEVTDTLATATWSAPASLTIASESFTPTTATVFLAAAGSATVGARAIVTCRYVTTGGRTDDVSFEITFVDGAAQAIDHYCTLDDVNAFVPQAPFTDTSKPNAAQVMKFINLIALRMDAMLGNLGYVVPVVAGANALELLRMHNAMGALGLAQQVRDTAVKTAVSESGRPAKNIWLQQFEEWLAQLGDNTHPFELTDAPRTDEQVLKSPADQLASFVQGITDDPDYVADAPLITRNQVF